MNSPLFPYYRFADFLRERFNCKVRKIAVDAGFSCPHRENREAQNAVAENGEKRGGCAWCDNSSFSAARAISLPISAQIQLGIAARRFATRAKTAANAAKVAEKFLVYFQPFTNTFAPVEKLRALYRAALTADNDVVGLAIGTRPDCVDAEKIALLSELAREKYVQIEYGLQTANDATLLALNRGHQVADFVRAVELSKNKNIHLVAHLIVGLPYETRDDALNSARLLADLKIDGVKIHHFHVVKNTRLGDEYPQAKWRLWEMDEYVETVVTMLEILPPRVVIHRLAAAPQNTSALLAPLWSPAEIHAAILAEFAKRRRLYA